MFLTLYGGKKSGHHYPCFVRDCFMLHFHILIMSVLTFYTCIQEAPSFNLGQIIGHPVLDFLRFFQPLQVNAMTVIFTYSPLSLSFDYTLHNFCS
jgi:hypothetical protein